MGFYRIVSLIALLHAMIIESSTFDFFKAILWGFTIFFALLKPLSDAVFEAGLDKYWNAIAVSFGNVDIFKSQNSKISSLSCLPLVNDKYCACSLYVVTVRFNERKSLKDIPYFPSFFLEMYLDY